MTFGEKEPLTHDDAANLAIDSEREFALRATQRDHLEVYHEPQEFFDGGKSTIPDFYVLNKKNPDAKGTFVEVSRSPNPNSIPGYRNDKKKKQRRVMDNQEEDINYTQLWNMLSQEGDG